MPISLRSSVHSIPKPWPSVLNLDVNMSKTNAKIAEELISSILSQAYILRGRQENEGLLRQVHERCPDYLFSRVNLAHLAIRDGDLNRAKELLEPLVKRRRLHYSELGAFCGAQIDLLVAEGKHHEARSWFDMWERADPENPLQQQWRDRLDPRSWLKRLLPWAS